MLSGNKLVTNNNSTMLKRRLFKAGNSQIIIVNNHISYKHILVMTLYTLYFLQSSLLNNIFEKPAFDCKIIGIRKQLHSLSQLNPKIFGRSKANNRAPRLKVGPNTALDGLEGGSVGPTLLHRSPWQHSILQSFP